MKAHILAMPKLPEEGISLLSDRYPVHRLDDIHAGRVPSTWCREIVAIASPGRDPGLGHRLDGRIFDQLPALRVVTSFSSGTDGIDGDAARQRGIPVLNVAEPLVAPVADVALALVIDVMRGITAGDRFVRAGLWARSEKQVGIPLAGRRAGIIGLGRIGAALATRLTACGMQVSYCNRSKHPDLPYRFHADAVELAAASDVLIACCPATPETGGMVSARVLEALGPDGYFVNISRGSVVDEPALRTALRTGGIAGAGLDVYQGEPAIDPDFFTLTNVVLSPHLGGATSETRRAMFHAMVANLTEYLASEQKTV